MTAWLNGQTLPDGWMWTSLDDITDIIQYGHTESASTQKIGPKFLRITDIQDGQVDWSSVPYCKCSDAEHQKYQLAPGDIVFARTGATTGKSYLIQSCPDAVFASYLIRLRVADAIYSKYLSTFFESSSYWSQITQVKKGSAQPGVNAAILSTLRLPLAPLNEQHRIVEAIETQFTRLDAAVTALKRSQANLKRYRAAVLNAACEGRLVPTEATLAQAEGRSYEPATVLIERILDERRRKWEAENPKKKYQEPVAPDTSGLPELPEGWAWATIDQATINLDHMRVPINKKERAERDSTIPYYGANGPVGWIDDYIFNEPLVLVVEDETFTGREKPFCYKISGKSWVNNHAHVLRAYAVTTEYLNYSLAYYPFTPLTTGTTGRRKLTKSALSNAPYAVPPLAEQHRIVAEVERRLSVIDQLEKTIVTDLARANRLRQSILKQAFAGQLVPQDPNDEPASVLLERIQAAKHGQPIQSPLILTV